MGIIALVLAAALCVQAMPINAGAAAPTIQPDLDLCPTCVSFMGDALNDLEQIIVNAGVVGSCSELCSLLPNELESTICDLLCSYVGIDLFIKLIQDVDPDPIWICEEIDVCPTAANASGNVTSLAVSPTQGPSGTTFDIDVVFQITSAIGTGSLEFIVAPPSGEAF